MEAPALISGFANRGLSPYAIPVMMPQGYPIIAFRLSFGMSELFLKREIEPESSLRAVGDADCTSME